MRTAEAGKVALESELQAERARHVIAAGAIASATAALELERERRQRMKVVQVIDARTTAALEAEIARVHAALREERSRMVALSPAVE